MPTVNGIGPNQEDAETAQDRRRRGRRAHQNPHLIKIMRNPSEGHVEPQQPHAALIGRELLWLCAACLVFWGVVSFACVVL
jgi:hypothetical protein